MHERLMGFDDAWYYDMLQNSNGRVASYLFVFAFDTSGCVFDKALRRRVAGPIS
jgi:hypothetical protein